MVVVYYYYLVELARCDTPVPAFTDIGMSVKDDMCGYAREAG